MPTTTISAAKQYVIKAVLHELEHGVHMPIYMHSSPGIGKSAIIRQVTKELNIGFEDVRLAQMEQADVAGIPYVGRSENDEHETMKVSVPEWFPSKERVKAGLFPEQGILFMDEMSNAPVPVQHSAYRIVLDREIHRGVELAEGWAIVSAGNMKSDKTGAKGVAPALANRYAMHLEIKSNLTDFTVYAFDTGLNKQVIGFLNFDASMLYNFDPKRNDVSFATPRSWEQVGNLLEVGYNDEELAHVIGGCVGDKVASSFMSFRKFYGVLPDFQKIMSGELDYKVPQHDNGVVFALVSSLIVNLVENATDVKKVKNLEKIMVQLEDDFLIMTYKTVKTLFDGRKNEQSDKAITSILMNTMTTFKKVSDYIKQGDVEA